MPEFKVVFYPLCRPIAADEAAKIHGRSNTAALVAAILENKDGRYDHLYTKTKAVNA